MTTIINRVSGGRPAFELKHPYTDLLDEVSSILSIYPDAVLFAENCFSIREERLFGIARQVSASGGALVLSARNISTEAEIGKLKGLRNILPELIEKNIGRLADHEVDDLISLIDQIAGWRKFKASSSSEKHRFIKSECKSIIPNVLVNLLNSEYVRNKYREEYNKIGTLDLRDREMIIGALIISNIGFDPPLSFVSNIFQRDFEIILRRLSNRGTSLKLARIEGSIIKTIPSIGARNLLKTIIDFKDIVNTTISILERLAVKMTRNDFEQHIFSQLMRYSILSSVVADEKEINRFFDHISKIPYFRDIPLFWLQWHMAMSAQGNWLKAEQYLEMGNTAAEAYDKRRGVHYNRKQLEDRRAKFLAARAIALPRSGVELFRDLKEAIDIVNRLLRDADLTHHPYETLLDVSRAFELRANTIIEVQLTILLNSFREIIKYASRRIGLVPEGYQRSRAIEWLAQINQKDPPVEKFI